jgi:hypothetical protein
MNKSGAWIEPLGDEALAAVAGGAGTCIDPNGAGVIIDPNG